MFLVALQPSLGSLSQFLKQKLVYQSLSSCNIHGCKFVKILTRWKYICPNLSPCNITKLIVVNMVSCLLHHGKRQLMSLSIWHNLTITFIWCKFSPTCANRCLSQKVHIMRDNFLTRDPTLHITWHKHFWANKLPWEKQKNIQDNFNHLSFNVIG
jgi:hypothetical protein